MPEKQFPSFREEDQHMAHEMKPSVVGPPAYASPDPNTNAGALVPVEDHPFELDKDYGGGVPKTVSISSDSEALGGSGHSVDLRPEEKADENRDEWTKEQWSAKAEELGVPKSGTKDEIRARVEEYEDNPPDKEDE